MQLNIKDTFNKELPADPILENTRRQVAKAAFSYVKPRKPSAPSLVHVSTEVADLIGASPEYIQSNDFLQVFSGGKNLEGTDPYAMCYGGHQFGHWAGQLGDGRAINLGEVVHNDQRWALQLKGAGETPYSRTADGLAVLRSSIREHLCSEAMFHLGVPTTRSLSLALTGDEVLRDVMYNGNAAYEKGAVVCRVSPSFIRFGNFQIFSARGDKESLESVVDYTIRNFFPHIEVSTKEGYLQFFSEVVTSTLEMVVHWQRVGFVHGVMNTDNMSILGLTIDYGPYGWLEGYDHGWTPNTTDSSERRYRYGNQPGIAHWNLFQLANALYPLIEEAAPLEEILNAYPERYEKLYGKMMKSKLGLEKEAPDDKALVIRLEEILQLTETDMTIFFRGLVDIKKDTPIDRGNPFPSSIMGSFYKPEELTGDTFENWFKWLKAYQTRLGMETLPDAERKDQMNMVNPKYVLRNYMAQLAIDAANIGNYSLIEELHQLLKNPYDEQPDSEKWFAKRPEWARHKVGCSMLSCSS